MGSFQIAHVSTWSPNLRPTAVMNAANADVLGRVRSSSFSAVAHVGTGPVTVMSTDQPRSLIAAMSGTYSPQS